MHSLLHRQPLTNACWVYGRCRYICTCIYAVYPIDRIDYRRVYWYLQRNQDLASFLTNVNK